VLIVGALFFSRVIAHYDELIPYRWQMFTSRDGTFSINLPGEPIVEDHQVMTTPERSAGTIHSVRANPNKNKHVSYSCTYSDSQRPDELLSEAARWTLEDFHRTLIAESRVSVGGYPGRDIQAQGPENSLLDERLVAVGNRLYLLEVLDTSSRNRDTKNVQKFFESFKTIGK
jgi:hypothetical protein